MFSSSLLFVHAVLAGSAMSAPLGASDTTLAAKLASGAMSASRAVSLTLAGFSSASASTTSDGVVASSSTTSSTRNIMWVDGPDQGTNSTDSGTMDDLTQLVTENTLVTHVILSSAHINNPANAPPYINFWNDLPINSSETAFIWPQVKQLQQSGVKVLLSLGGADDGSWGHLLANFNEFYAPLLSALQTYGFDGVDLDIETAYTTAGALQLLEQLNSDLGPDFLLTMSPVQQCLSESGDCSFGSINYQQLDNTGTYPNRANSKLVSFYNTQFYAGGGDGANSPSEYEAVVAAGFAALRVVMGVADCSTDGSGWFPLSTYNSVVTQLREKYGSNFGGVFGWDWNNAGSCEGLAHPWQWVKQMGEILYGSLS